MVKYLGNPHSLFIITFIAFVVPCFCDPTDIISSCLIRHNVYNFTLLPHNGSQSPDYYRLLNFSLQNLRYAVPTAPKPVAIAIPQSLKQLVNSMRCCREGWYEFRVRCGGHSYEGISSVVPDGNPFVIIDMMSLNQVSVDVRCGGHSYEGISSVVPDGNPFVIIDMMSLNQVSVDVESETAWVEGGATLGETYYAVAEASNVHGFSAGSCPTVGVGGHIAGGGFGLLSRKYGLAADNVVDALLIDADGRVLDRKAMGEDVFWAIRGGGGGDWGIVYAWKIKLLKVPETVTSCIMSRTRTKLHVAELVHKWQFIAPRLEPSFYLSVFVGAGLQGVDEETGVSASFKGFYLGSRNEAMSILNRVFPELGVEKEDCREMSWIESILYFSGLPNGSSISELRNRYLEDKLYFKAKSDYVRTPISMEGLVTALDILEMEPKGSVVLDPYGGEMEKISSDALPFPHRKGNLFSIQYMVAWEEDSTAMSNKYIDWIRGFYKWMMPYVSQGPRAAYVNYMDLDLGQMNSSISSNDPVEAARDWGEKYFLNNYDRLVKVKTCIDPDNVFNNQQGIPPMPTARLNNRSEGLGVSERCMVVSY